MINSQKKLLLNQPLHYFAPCWPHVVVSCELVLIIAYMSCSSKQERVDQGIETEGSNLSGVSAKCVWDDLSRPPEDEEDSRSICIGSQPRRLSDKGMPRPQIRENSTSNLRICRAESVARPRTRVLVPRGLPVHDWLIPGGFFVCVLTDTEQIRETLRKGLEFNSKAAIPPISSQRQGHERPQ